MAELSVERIADAALTVADERGAAGFTMRAVAEQLGVTPMALYHHVADKAALVAVLVDAVISERPLPAPTGAWEDDLWEMAKWMRAITRAHPAVARLRHDYQVWTPSIFPMTERWLSVWQQSGLDLDQAVFAAAATSTAIIGFVNEELVLRNVQLPDDAALAAFPNARLALRAERRGEFEFELVVRSVIAGFHDRLAGSATEHRRATRARGSSDRRGAGSPASATAPGPGRGHTAGGGA